MGPRLGALLRTAMLALADLSTAPTRTLDPTILYLGTPVVLVSTRNADGSANLAPISSSWWLGRTGVLGIGTRSQTVANLRREGQLVASYPSEGLAAAVDRLAGTTGADPMPGYKRAMGFAHVADKFERAGLTAVASEAVGPPRVAECPIQIECEVLSVREVGPSGVDHAAAVEVRAVRTHVHEAILKAGHRHHIDPERWRPLVMSFLEFYGLGPRVRPSHLAEIF